MPPDSTRLQSLIDRLRDLEHRIPAAHERAILEVAKAAVVAEIHTVTQRLHAGDYWRVRRSTQVA